MSNPHPDSRDDQRKKPQRSTEQQADEKIEHDQDREAPRTGVPPDSPKRPGSSAPEQQR